MSVDLAVTVDTEEDGAWDGKFAPAGHTVENLRGLPRFHALCQRYRIRPTYLIDAPVVKALQENDFLEEYHRARSCEIGAHLHPWCTPPFTEQTGQHNSFLCNLPEPLQRDKITWLTEAIESRFHHRPTSFRAGRYGLDIIGARILNDLGYVVDSSVIPYTDYTDHGGPNFNFAPVEPYVVGNDNLCIAQETGSLIEAPLTVGFSRSNFARAAKLRRTASQSGWRRLRAVGILDRLGIARRIKFSPEQSDSHRMRQLVNACHARRSPLMVMSLHSSSLWVGCSPYARDDRALEKLYVRLEDTFAYCTEVKRMNPITLSEWAASGRTHAT